MKWYKVSVLESIWILKYTTHIYLNMGLGPPTNVNDFEYHIRASQPNRQGLFWYKLYFKPLSIKYIITDDSIIMYIIHDKYQQININFSKNPSIMNIIKKIDKNIDIENHI